MIDALIIFITTFLVIGFGLFVFLRFLGVDVYPSPKFSCSECEQVKVEKLGIYECQACTDEINGDCLFCIEARGTRDCWKNARKVQ